MAFEKPAIEVVLFQNRNKKSEKAPDGTGSIKFNQSVTFNAGDELDLALWNRTSKSGLQFKSGLAKPKYEGGGSGGGGYAPRPARAPREDVVDLDF